MDEAELTDRLSELKLQHRELDNEIRALDASAVFNQIRRQKLKKEKLVLKDQIVMIEDQLLPDIIA